MSNILGNENNPEFQDAKGRGRPKGSQNRTTRAAKEAIELAAEGLGGYERLVEWAQSDPINERVFWSQMYTKLMPLQVTGDADNPLHMVNKIEFAIVKPEN